MKTLCCACNHYMEYECHAPVAEGAVGIVFECAKCRHRIQLVTNAGETMLVHAMGVKIGNPGETGEPLELTRSTLCDAGESESASIRWSAGARERVERIPPAVRAFAVQSIEDYALRNGRAEITEQVLDEYKAAQGHA